MHKLGAECWLREGKIQIRSEERETCEGIFLDETNWRPGFRGRTSGGLYWGAFCPHMPTQEVQEGYL